MNKQTTEQGSKELQEENEKLHKEVKILKKSQDEVKKEIEHSFGQQERMEKSLRRSRMDEAEKKISDLQDNMEQ